MQSYLLLILIWFQMTPWNRHDKIHYLLCFISAEKTRVQRSATDNYHLLNIQARPGPVQRSCTSINIHHHLISKYRVICIVQMRGLRCPETMFSSQSCIYRGEGVGMSTKAILPLFWRLKLYCHQRLNIQPKITQLSRDKALFMLRAFLYHCYS